MTDLTNKSEKENIYCVSDLKAIFHASERLKDYGIDCMPNLIERIKSICYGEYLAFSEPDAVSVLCSKLKEHFKTEQVDILKVHQHANEIWGVDVSNICMLQFYMRVTKGS